MQPQPANKPDDRQNNGKTQTEKRKPGRPPDQPSTQDASQPLSPVLERLIQYRLSGLTQAQAYQQAKPGHRTKSSREQGASKLFRREEVKNRLAWLTVNTQKPAENGGNQVVDQAEIKSKSSGNRPNRTQSVDNAPLTRELVRAMLVRALTTETPNSATVSAITAAQKFLDSETPADSRPGPETIADYLANGAPTNKAEIARIVSTLCKAYDVTRQQFMEYAHLSMETKQGDIPQIIRHCDEIPPKSADDLSSNNNDLGL